MPSLLLLGYGGASSGDGFAHSSLPHSLLKWEACHVPILLYVCSCMFMCVHTHVCIHMCVTRKWRPEGNLRHHSPDTVFFEAESLTGQELVN